MGRHDFGAADEAGGPVDLAAIVADDALLDVLGRHRRSAASGPGSAPVAPLPVDGVTAGPPATAVPPDAGETELTELFATWRAVVDADPLPEPPTVDSVVLALRRVNRRRSLRPMFGIAVAICALLVGSAAIGARTARPGDVLWPVTQVLWSDRAESVVAGDTTRVALGHARMALDAGLTSEARSALVAASTVLPRVADRDGHEDLKKDMDTLWSTLDWVQQQHAVPAVQPAPAAPSPTAEPGPEAPVGTTATSSPADSVSASSSPAGSSSTAGPTSSPPPASSTGTSTERNTVPPATSAPLAPAPPSSAPPPAPSTTPPVPTPPTSPTTAPTAPSTPSPPTSPAPSTPTAPTPSTDTSTQPSPPSSPSEPSTSASSATQEVVPVVPSTTESDATVAHNGEQTLDPAQQQQEVVQQGSNG